MIDLKPLSTAAVSRAIAKAEHYRLLNEPWAAESICLDVLAAQPGDQYALRLLLLAQSDQFVDDPVAGVERARDTLSKLTSEYEQRYYAGLICERRARAQLERNAPGAGFVAHDWIREAMSWYDQAAELRPAGDDDAILRWNTCARLLNQMPELGPRVDDESGTILGE